MMEEPHIVRLADLQTYHDREIIAAAWRAIIETRDMVHRSRRLVDRTKDDIAALIKLASLYR
jgi:hypothetical protein